MEPRRRTCAWCPNEQEEALVRGLLRGFEAFGGVPLVTVWDNPKTVVQARARAS